MKIEFTQAKVECEEVVVVAKLSTKLKEIEGDCDSRYGGRNLKDHLFDEIAKRVADEYLKTKKMDIINGLDLQQIINAIHLKVIENFSIQN